MSPSRNLDLIAGLHELRDRAATASREVTVAVLDGPVDRDHPSLAAADVRVPNGIDPQVATPGRRLSTHGTHVTSVLFGQDGSPVQGICPRARGLIIPIYQASTGRAPQLDIARAIEVAIAEGADIINFSGGQYTDTGVPDAWLSAAVQRCAEQDVLLVAAAGNDGCECLHVPAAVSTALAVGAIDDSGMPMDFSNWGDGYACHGIAAPGKDILGALPGGGTELLSGTSFATPMVSGVAALLIALMRQREPGGHFGARVRDALLAGVSPCRSDLPIVCQRLLAGTLSIAGALEALGLSPNAQAEAAVPAELTSLVSHVTSGSPALGVVGSGGVLGSDVWCGAVDG